MLRLPSIVEFDWDDGNRDKNWLKHQVTKAEVEEIFFIRVISARDMSRKERSIYEEVNRIAGT